MTLSYKEFISESLRLLHTVGNGNRTAKIYKDAEWGEHRVKFYTDGQHHKEADYHTNDKGDAHDTASHWVNQQQESVVTSTNVGKLFPKKRIVDGVTINPTIADPKNKSISESTSELSDAAHELMLHADNDSHLYHSSKVPIMKNLLKKKAKGTYDSGLATKLWGYHADRAAQSYHKQFGTKDQPWHQMFSKSDRHQAASHWEKHTELHDE